MKATTFEFRFRFWILIAVFVLGFAAPWNYALHLDGAGPNTHVWGQLAIELSRAGMNIAAVFRAVLIAGIALAIAGAALRTWATANPGPEVMRGETLRTAGAESGSIPTSQNRDVGHPVTTNTGVLPLRLASLAQGQDDGINHGLPDATQAELGWGTRLVVTGPYRYVRNPLYLGLWLNALALALLMPPSGAIFTLVLLLVFQLRLILAEEAWLGEQLGEAYAEYCGKVPRIVPRLRSRSVPSGGSSSSVADERKFAIPTSLRDVGHPAAGGVGGSARWGKAALAEIFLWGTAVSFAALGWEYNAHLLIQCVLVSLGLALVAKGIAMEQGDS